MKDVLIIRSASFQQLDMNLVAIREKMADCNISLLTHAHGVKLAEKYKMIDHIYVYPYKEGFRYKNKVKDLQDKEFGCVVIPVTNLSASGFFNVLLFSLSIKAKRRMICNLVSEMWEINRLGIAATGLRNVLFSLVSYLFAAAVGVVIIWFLPFQLRRLERKE